MLTNLIRNNPQMHTHTCLRQHDGATFGATTGLQRQVWDAERARRGKGSDASEHSSLEDVDENVCEAWAALTRTRFSRHSWSTVALMDTANDLEQFWRIVESHRWIDARGCTYCTASSGNRQTLYLSGLWLQIHDIAAPARFL